MNVVDSSGWIEYFFDSPRADLFAEPIELPGRLIVPTVALYEVSKVLARTVPDEVVAQCLDVMRRGRVVALTDPLAVLAANLGARYKLALSDAVFYATAQHHKAMLWTQDEDYEGLAGVRYFAKGGAT